MGLLQQTLPSALGISNPTKCASVGAILLISITPKSFPEATPGPHDSRYLFDDFMDLIKNQS